MCLYRTVLHSPERWPATNDETMQYTVDVEHLTYVVTETLLRVERSLSSSLIPDYSIE